MSEQEQVTIDRELFDTLVCAAIQHRDNLRYWKDCWDFDSIYGVTNCNLGESMEELEEWYQYIAGRIKAACLRGEINEYQGGR